VCAAIRFIVYESLSLVRCAITSIYLLLAEALDRAISEHDEWGVGGDSVRLRTSEAGLDVVANENNNSNGDPNARAYASIAEMKKAKVLRGLILVYTFLG
jgi:hypothetical protein